MNGFIMNGYLWHIYFVSPNDPVLTDRTGHKTVATTDPVTQCIYLSDTLHGEFLVTVLIHELSHCATISHHLLQDIHQVVAPEYWIEAEEWICNFVADYGLKIFDIAMKFLGDQYFPKSLKQFIM